MKEKTLVEIRVKGASTRDSNIALRKAVEAVAANDPDFHARMTENGIEYIVDASPGCVRLPVADAERVADRLRSLGHDIATRSLSLAIAFRGLYAEFDEKGSKMMGRYQSDNLQGYIDDWIVHVLVITRTKDVGARLTELHVRVHEEYAAQESPQEAVWILGQPVPLLADGIDG